MLDAATKFVCAFSARGPVLPQVYTTPLAAPQRRSAAAPACLAPSHVLLLFFAANGTAPPSKLSCKQQQMAHQLIKVAVVMVALAVAGISTTALAGPIPREQCAPSPGITQGQCTRISAACKKAYDIDMQWVGLGSPNSLFRKRPGASARLDDGGCQWCVFHAACEGGQSN